MKDSTVTSHQEGSWFESCVCVVWSLHVLPVSVWVFAGFLLVSEDMEIGIRLIIDLICTNISLVLFLAHVLWKSMFNPAEKPTNQ